MGMMKAINAKREEIRKKYETESTFLDLADRLKSQFDELQKSLENIEKLRARIAKDISGLNTYGVKEFEEYKASLEGISRQSGDFLGQLLKVYARPLPIRPLQEVMKREYAEQDKMMAAWIDKHAAAFPKEIKPGMTFRSRTGALVEVLSKDYHNYSVKIEQDGKSKVDKIGIGLLSLKLGYKYLAG